MRQSIKRRARNRTYRTRMRNEIKELRETVAGSDAATAAEQLRAATSTIQKLAAKGVIHKKTASRKTGRLAKRVSRLAKAAQATA